MKNYLVKGIHKITSPHWWPGRDRTDEGDIYAFYKKMNEVSEASFCHYLEGDWELITLVGDATDINHVFRQQFRGIWDIWSNEPCNILYCGSDTQMVRKTKVFGEYKHFLLFNYTDPRTRPEVGCEHHLNADIRYYPAEMNREMFANALAELNNACEWGQDQLLYNKMVWDQGLTPKQVVDPKMAYQGHWLPHVDRIMKDCSDVWNGCKLEESHIVHWGATRGAHAKLQLMQDVSRDLKIPQPPVRPITRKTIDVSNVP